MFDTQFYLSQDPDIMSMIESSLFRCEKASVPRYTETLPAVTREKQTESRQHVSGHTLLIRESSPKYYRQLTEVLDAHKALLIYVAPNFDLYGRYGNPELKQELRNINMRFGTNADERLIGTNAVALAARCQKGVWTVGKQNYAPVLHNYAFYAFTVHSKYNRMSHVLLAVRKKDLNEEIYSLFKLIEATESIFSAGLVTKDVLLKDAYIGTRFSESHTENLLVIVDNNGQIAYANNPFYNMFHLTYNDVINNPLAEIVPDLAYTLDALQEGRKLPPSKQIRFRNAGPFEFYVTCSLQSSGGQQGLIITAQKTIPIAEHHEGVENGARYYFDDLIGVSEKFNELKLFAKRVADTDCTILIRGESGTGKELFAHSIHNASNRWKKPFISVNCAAIPRELIGSELFGYVGGAFTGASRTGTKGKFEQADGGTLFLDEIGEMPVDMQSVLLRVLEEGQITRIGGSKPIPVNVRLVAATNQDLEQYIKEGRFRLDLFYRLNIISLNIIPLREHKEDINALTDVFIQRFSGQFHNRVTGISMEARAALNNYDWPGNVRELRNVVERGVVTAYGNSIQLEDLPEEISGTTLNHQPVREVIKHNGNDGYTNIAEVRKARVKELMQKYDGNKAKVARQLGVARSTLYRILHELNMN